jgi:hypothetical protein
METTTNVEYKRRGKKPSGVVKDNVCVRLTDESQDYLKSIGAGSKSRGVDKLIAWHQSAAVQPSPQEPALEAP